MKKQIFKENCPKLVARILPLLTDKEGMKRQGVGNEKEVVGSMVLGTVCTRNPIPAKQEEEEGPAPSLKLSVD